MSETRQFDTGATRNSEEGKFDYEGFLCFRALERYAQYMHKHRHLDDGTLRDSDNWQQGIPLSVYVKSLWRHVIAVSKHNRGIPEKEPLEDALCGILFNTFGYLHEHLKSTDAKLAPFLKGGEVGAFSLTAPNLETSRVEEELSKVRDSAIVEEYAARFL